MIRVAITGDPDLVDALTTLCTRSGYRIVHADGFGIAVQVMCTVGPTLIIDTVEGPLESRLEGNLEMLHGQWNCGHYQKVRAVGNRNPHAVRCQIPAQHAEGVLLAIYRTLLQCYPPARRRRWRAWWVGAGLALLPTLSVAQTTTPFQQLDANTGSVVNERVFMGLFAPSATGAVAVELPTTLGVNGGLRIDLLNPTISVTQSGTWTVQPGNTPNTTAWLFKLSQTTSDNDVDIVTFPDNEPVNVAQMNGVAVSMGVGASGTGTQRTATLMHDGTDTAQVTPTSGGSLQMECAAGCVATATNYVAIGGQESVAAPTAAVWYIKRQWALPTAAVFTPDHAWAAITTALTKTRVAVINNLGNLNLSTNTFTAANSVASPFFYGQLMGCVTTVMSAVADTITPTYTDELGNSQAATAVAFASASPVGNCYVFPLAVATGPTLDSGVRAVTAATDTAAPTGVVTFYGVNLLADFAGTAANQTETQQFPQTPRLTANEEIAILMQQVLVTAQLKTYGVGGSLR